MLPDYPETKRDLVAALRRYARARFAAHSPALTDIPRFQVFEGTGTEIQRPSGTVEESDDLKMSAALSFATADLPNLTMNQVIEKLDAAALEMAQQGMEQFISSLRSATERSGNVVEGRGRQLSAELMIEMLEKIALTCDDSGKLQLPTILIGPNQLEAVRAAEAEMERNPELKRRYENVLDMKREEFRVREASRKLVG